MKEKLKLELVDCNSLEGIPVEWTKIDSETLDAIPSDKLYNRTAISGTTGKFITKTVVFLKKVDKFSKGVKTFEESNAIIGIPTRK